MNRDLASTPSLCNIRSLIAEIFLGKGRELEVGRSFHLDISSQRIRYDLTTDDVSQFYRFLEEEGVLSEVDRFDKALRYVKSVPRVCHSHDDIVVPGEVDIFRVLQHFGIRHRDSPVFDLKQCVLSGLLQCDEHRDSVLSVRTFRLLRDPQLSEIEIDGLVERYGAHLRATDRFRAKHHRAVLDIFTKNQCFMATLVQGLGLWEQMPPGWSKCGQCLYCVTHKAAKLPSLSRQERGVDPAKLQAVIRAVPKRYAQDVRFLTRVALGVRSFRIQALISAGYYLGSRNDKVFGSMRLNSFEVCHCFFHLLHAVHALSTIGSCES